MALIAAAAYPLGRYHKLRWAFMLAAFGATGRLESPGQFALRGVKGLANAPELAELTDAVRDQLLDAGRAAAMSAASSSIGSLTDRLNDQTEALRKPAADVAGGVSKAAGRSSSEDEDDKADEAEEAEVDDSAEQEQPRRRPPGSAGRSSTRNGPDEGAERRRRPARDTGDDSGLKTRSQTRTARVGDDGGGSPVRRKG
jgi:hypothetical protein